MNIEYKKFISSYSSNQKSLNKALNTRSRNKGFDKIMQTAHNEVFKVVDCLDCANCCKTTGPLFTPSDIKNISAKLKLSERNFSEKYLLKDSDGDMILKSLPCPFLASDNTCNIYDYRPRACRKYPHTDEKGQKSILHLTRKNAKICPAVSKIIQVVADLG